MVGMYSTGLLKGTLSCINSNQFQRGLSTSSVLCRNIRAGKVKIKSSTDRKVIRLTYDRALPPETIGVKKAWLSWNTSNLKDEDKGSLRAFEDIFIRKFITGTWVDIFRPVSDTIIKRRANCIYVSFVLKIHEEARYHEFPAKLYFMKGYTEEMLSIILKCPVKIELSCATYRESIYQTFRPN